MTQYFCASDIHSFYDEWVIALKYKGFDLKNPEHKIIVCGDLFDRGTQSRECFDFMSDMLNQNRAIYVRGNHEDLLLECVKSIHRRIHTGSHHISNGTIRTLANMMDCSEYDILCHVYAEAAFDKAVGELTSLINKSVDFFELNDKIFVHGWVPTTCDENRTMIVHENWRDGNWNEARWENGMEMAHFKLTVPNKTVVCGHWHTSWGHSKYHNDGDEWDGTSANFDPFIDEGIIAIDACTAYTHQVNVIVFNENGEVLSD